MVPEKKMITTATRPFKRYEEDYKWHSIRRAREAGTITEGDADRIREFIESQKARGRTEGYLLHMVIGLCQWGQYLSPFDKIAPKAVTRGITGLMGTLGTGTVNQRINALKVFASWMIDQGYAQSLTHEDIRRIKKVKDSGKSKSIRTGDILTPAEVLRILERGALNTRDKALISLLYESGCRIQEACTLTWSDLTFDKYGVQMNVQGKTDKPRYVRLAMAAEYMSAWKRDYPRDFAAEGDALVFVTHNQWKSRGTSLPMSYEPTRELIIGMAKRAGITKRVRPHLFRHSRITHLLQQGYPESIVKMVMWGTLKTDMLGTYGHLVQLDTDKAVLERLGILPQEGMKDNPLAPRQCPSCHTVCGPDAAYCSKCGTPLTGEASIDERQTLAEIRSTALYQTIMKDLRQV